MYVDQEGEFPPFPDCMADMAGTGTNWWPSFLQTRILVASTATGANSVKRAVGVGLHCGQPNPPLARSGMPQSAVVHSITEYLWFEVPNRRGFVNITSTLT